MIPKHELFEKPLNLTQSLEKVPSCEYGVLIPQRKAFEKKARESTHVVACIPKNCRNGTAESLEYAKPFVPSRKTS